MCDGMDPFVDLRNAFSRLAFPASQGTLPRMNEFMSDRRQFIRGTGAWLGASALGLGAGAGAEETRTVSLFHTTDLHGHILPTQTYSGVQDVGGFARCVSCIRQWRKEAPDSLLLDIGDVYQGTAESLINGGKLMIGLFNRLGYDAWTLGNHDFDWGPEVLEANLALSKSPVLTGNIRVHGQSPGALEGAWKGVLPWTMKEVGGFRIALIGLVTPGLPFWLAPETLGGVSPTDPGESLKRSIAEARSAKADAVVVMGHMGWRHGDDFANPVREILKDNSVDVFLAGHTHQDKPSWEVGSVLCSQASYHGIHCGRVDLTFDVVSRQLVNRRVFTVLMDKRFDLDPVVMEVAQPELKKADEQMARVVGTAKALIPGTGRGSRLTELFCEFFSEALQRNQTPVDGIFHGSFGTGDVAAGVIKVADCWKMLPYENLLATAELSATELAEIVREDRKDRQSDRRLWPFELALDHEGNPTRFLYKGTPVAADRRFIIGFNSYDLQSGGKKLMRLREIAAGQSAKRLTTKIDTRSALIDGILNRKELA
jgi:2',3'-cyclic-nucleotide 2'-phosphodiesterase (5'-nucleotidase family)